jgi:putative thioredoxin
MAGAVDLAAIKARSDAAARAAEAPPPGAADLVVDVSEATFQADVVERSFQVPVLMCFWTARAPSSEQLLASLERLARADGGSWVFARVDVDTNMRIAQALQVQGVPAVYAVVGGQPLPGFEGALPDDRLREFVDAVVNAGKEAGLTGVPAAGADDAPADEPQPPEDPRFDAAEAALAEGDYALAQQRFQAILDVEPANAEAALALRQVALMARLADTAPDVTARADAAPDDVAAALGAADLAFAGGDADAALNRLLGTLTRTAGDEREQVRQRLLDYFELLGPDDARVPAARRQLARALF